MATLGSVLLCAGIAHAQELPDLTGKWSMTATGFEDDSRCGEISATGELDVARKIAVRAYRGKFVLRETFSKCDHTRVSESAVTVRIRDHKVSIDHDEDDWTRQSLFLTDAGMSGKDKDGVVSEWTRQLASDEPVVDVAAAMQSLEVYLDEVEPHVMGQLRDYYVEKLTPGLVVSGLSEDEAGQVAELTMQRMLTCMFDDIRDMVRVQGVLLDDLLRNNKYVLTLNPRNIDFAGDQCVQDASLNAGVAIK